ncbi:MAG: YeeE/YedE thiosulfate transporter family protein [Myxococcales bacterium]
MDQEFRTSYWNSYKAGILLGLVLLATFVLMGRGLGASGAMTRIASYGVDKVDAVVHGGTAAEATTLAKKNAYMSQFFDGGDPFDDFLVYMFFGVLAGGFVGGLKSKRFGPKIVHGPRTTKVRRIVLAIIGGIISAFGARLARGCTSGLALTGGATLALGSWVFMFAVFGGGYAVAYFMRKEWT